MAAKTTKKTAKVAKATKSQKKGKVVKALRKDSGQAEKKCLLRKQPLKSQADKATKVAKAAAKAEESAIPSPEKQEIIAQYAVKTGDTGARKSR